VYIVKPKDGAQGNGIFLTNTISDLNPSDTYIAQQYIPNPLLIDQLKFDLRLYVLILSVDPLKIYLFDEGIARFSTEKYVEPSEENFKNTYMHLTNYSLNKNNTAKFIHNENEGHKRTFSSILEHI
jgi:hypothetical protein